MSFTYEKAVIEKLKQAQIPGLHISEAVDIELALKKAGMRPTCYVSRGDEVAVQTKGSAALADLDMHVAVILRGSVPEREDADTFFTNAVFDALQDELLPGLTIPLAWVATLPSFDDGARIYQLTFKTQLTKRKRSA